MGAFILSPEAEGDLGLIKRYPLREAGVRITRYVLRELLNGMRFAATNPEVGHVREDLTGEPVKFWPVFSYLIVYDLQGSRWKLCASCMGNGTSKRFWTDARRERTIGQRDIMGSYESAFDIRSHNSSVRNAWLRRRPL
jgi:toxin ParE1/3/4